MAPWTNKTGLAKATAILAMVLGVSLGLCGVNFAFVSLMDVSNGRFLNSVGAALGATGWIELAGIIVGLVGLIVVGVIAVVSAVGRVIFPQDRIDTEE